MRRHNSMQDETTVQAVQEGDVVDGSPEEQAQDAASSQNTELEQLKGERDQLLDRLARLQAEFDNARKREAKERQDARDSVVSSTVEPFLGVMDNFQLAL
ncbi:MAG TPA: nucleotide exchange factor GrpE, partial [Edaphobacter sp.]|nr:nucleotide exchange factor GrpE [Edaphobacter sp.]